MTKDGTADAGDASSVPSAKDGSLVASAADGSDASSGLRGGDGSLVDSADDGSDASSGASAEGVVASADDGSDASSGASADPRTFEEKRRDQLTSAPAAVESDADPRIDVTETDDGTTRIDWRPDAPIKPGPA